MREKTFSFGILLTAVLILIPGSGLSQVSGKEAQGSKDTAGTKAGSEEKNKEAGVLSFTVKTIDGKSKKVSDYKGRVLLIVNTASKCGFTPQYKGMQELYETYKDKGFQILAFPANNFMAQEPGSDEEIRTFCQTNFGVTFDLFSKISVKGKEIHPLYKYLTEESEHKGKISWNFNKFLIDKKGRVVARFNSYTKPKAPALVKKLETLLEEKG